MGKKTARKLVVVDGANIAYAERSASGRPKVVNLIAVRDTLKERGYESIIIVDASLRHEIDDPDRLEALIRDQTVRQAPAGTDADYFVIATAEEHHARIVSNDQYAPWADQYPWLRDRRIPLMIIQGRVELYEELPEQNGRQQEGKSKKRPGRRPKPRPAAGTG
ncbi:MAG TPA: hypothetical protein VFD58_10340 [Blastocatellia bacterium]|nr:hypothetical protein [Blastocatellia bacterium]